MEGAGFLSEGRGWGIIRRVMGLLLGANIVSYNRTNEPLI